MLKIFAMAATLASQAASTPAPPAAPAGPPCLTREQIGDFSVISIAISVGMMRNACRTHLPPTAWLATPAATEYAARLRTEARQRLPSALAGISRMMGGQADAATTEMARAMTEGMLTEGAGADFARYLDPQLCRDASEIVEIGSTLSPDQMGRLFGAFASIVDHFFRMGPDSPFGPLMRGHFPAPPAPPGAAPAPRPTPAVFELERGTRRSPPAARPVPSPRPPLQPFMCRSGE